MGATAPNTTLWLTLKKIGNILNFFYSNKIKFCPIICFTLKQKEKAPKKKFNQNLLQKKKKKKINIAFKILKMQKKFNKSWSGNM